MVGERADRSKVVPELLTVPLIVTVPPLRIKVPMPAGVNVPPRATAELVAVIVPLLLQLPVKLIDVPLARIEPVLLSPFNSQRPAVDRLNISLIVKRGAGEQDAGAAVSEEMVPWLVVVKVELPKVPPPEVVRMVMFGPRVSMPLRKAV